MTLWSERYNHHPLWPKVEEARNLVNALVIEDTDGDAQDALAYVGMVLELVERRKTDSDAHEIAPGMLDRAYNAVDSWVRALDSVVDDSRPIRGVLGETDAVLEALATWPPMKPARYLSGIAASVEAFQSKVSEVLASTSSKSADVTEKLKQLETAQATLKGSIDNESQRIAEALADFKLSSNEAVAEVVSAKEGELERTLSDYQAKAEALIAALKQHEESARDTVHATTAHMVATDYGKYARNKTVAAWVCDIAGAIVGAAGVGALLYHLYSLDATADANVGLSLTRFAVSVGTLGVAALLARRGSQHHKEARAAKRTDLALRRVMPFIVNLPVEEQQEIVLDFTERVFIRGDLDSAAAVDDKSFRDRIKAIRETRSKREQAARAEGASA